MARPTAAKQVQVSGKIRHSLLYPDVAKASSERALQGAVISERRDSKFRSLNLGSISKKQRAEARNLKASLVAYSQQYGTPAQTARFEAMNPARVRWMVDNGIIIIEEVFNYDDVLDQYGFKLTGSPARAKLQRYIDAYDKLMVESQ